MKGILKNTKAGWFVLYQVTRDEITSGYDSIPLHPDSQTWMDGYNLYEGKEVLFELVMDKPEHRYSETPYAKTIDEDDLGCSYPHCICQGNEITDCNNRTPDQVVLGDKTALVEDVFHQGHKKLSFRERCMAGNYTPFNIENLMGELSKKKKEPYITQEEFEEFHNTIMDGLKIPKYGK
jgi:hypothetical protein